MGVFSLSGFNMAAGDQSTTTADWLVKYLYADGLNEEALVSSNALLKYVEKDKSFTSSKGMVIPVSTSNTQVGYATNADAYAARAGGTGDEFLVPVRTMLGMFTLSSNLVRLTEAGSDESQFVNILERDVDGATENFGQEVNLALYGRNLGERARVHATTAISGTSLTLANPEDAAYFAVDMRVSAINPADDTLRDSGDFISITAINPITGVLTGDANWSNISGITTGDILIRWGTRNTRLDGLAGWCPETPSSSFLGVNQTLNRVSNAGVYVDVSSYAIRPGLLRAAAVMKGQLGQGMSKAPFFMNPADVMEIVSSVEAVKVVETELKTKYNVGLDVIEVLGCKIIEDRHCPVGRAFVIPQDAFTLGTAGDCPHLDEQDGKAFHYDRQNGRLECVMAFDGNSYSSRVNTLAHIKLPTRTPL